jgi:hypothetical protein
MEFFKSFIAIMAYASLGFSAAAAYLKINKVWKRKHNAEVANSVSIMGNVIDVMPLSFFALNFLFAAQWQGFIDSLIWIVAGAAMILIGSGFWVPENRRKSFWTEFKQALKLEGSEVGHLASALFRPSGADIVLEILTQFAYIDRELDPREKNFIESFADAWHVDLDWQKYLALADLDEPASLVRTRDTVERYLKTSPPTEQVSQLIDVLQSLVSVDDTVSGAEALILREVRGLLSNYINDVESYMTFSVVIAPQNHDNDVAISTLLPDAAKTPVAGGIGYIVGTYFSQEYANVICDQYRALGFFTVDMARKNVGREA